MILVSNAVTIKLHADDKHNDATGMNILVLK